MRGLLWFIIAIISNLGYGWSLYPPLFSPSSLKSIPSAKSTIMPREKISPVEGVPIRGGATSSSSNMASVPIDAVGDGHSFSKILASFWSVSGVMMILLKSVKRIVPIAMEPFQATMETSLTPFQLG